MAENSIEAAIVFMAQALRGLRGYASNADGEAQLLRTLGWEMPPGVEELGIAAIDLSDILASDGPLDWAKVTKKVLESLDGLATGFASLPGDYPTATNILKEFVPRLLDHLVMAAVERSYPILHAALTLTGVFSYEWKEPDADHYQPAHVRRHIAYERVPGLITDPLEHRTG